MLGDVGEAVEFIREDGCWFTAVEAAENALEASVESEMLWGALNRDRCRRIPSKTIFENRQDFITIGLLLKGPFQILGIRRHWIDHRAVVSCR